MAIVADIYQHGTAETDKLVAPDGQTGDFAGTSVDLFNFTAVSGAYFATHAGQSGAGAAHLFDLDAPPSPDIDGSGQADSSDVSVFTNVLMGTDIHPVHVQLADVNCSGQCDGRDIQAFVDLF